MASSSAIRLIVVAAAAAAADPESDLTAAADAARDWLLDVVTDGGLPKGKTNSIDVGGAEGGDLTWRAS